VSYLTQDHLGSPRVVTDKNGEVLSRKDYSAFGEELVADEHRSESEEYGGGEVRKGYTGYEKDSESGLEFAQARYYNTIHGRFTSVDPLTASASIKNPQTLNRYSYVLNSPYKYVDPLGLLAENSSGNKCNFQCRVTNAINGSGTLSDADKELAKFHIQNGTALGYAFLNASYAAINRPTASQSTLYQNLGGSSPYPSVGGTGYFSNGDGEAAGSNALSQVPLPRSRELFMQMWAAYPTFSLGQHDLFFDANGNPSPVNQCAIRFSYAILQVKETANRYWGYFSMNKYLNKENYIIRAADMAAWTRSVFRSPITMTGPNIADQLKDRIGIVFLRNFPGVDVRGTFNHVDLWNGFAGRLGSSTNPRYISEPGNWFDNAAEVLFWEFK